MPRLDFYTDRTDYKPFFKVKLGEKGILIGRDGDCDIQCPNGRVSRHHARIESQEAGSYWIEDLSVHGTRLNAAMLEERTRLGSGDRIYIESYVIVFQLEDVSFEAMERGVTTLN